MYTAVIVIHSWLRWAVIVLGLIAVFQAIGGRSSRRAWAPGDAKPGRLYTIALDIQMLLGLILYFALSPATRAAMQNMGAAMSNATLRYWSVEHLVGMVLAVAAAHIGQTRMRRAATNEARYKTGAMFVAIALVLILISIPWPGMPTGRPLFRF